MRRRMSDSKKGPDTAKRMPPNAGKGRPKGALNKSTKAVKDALVQAFDELGGVDSLKLWASENKTAFYQLWGKMLPLQVTGEDGGPIVTRVELAALDDDSADQAS